MLTLEETLVQQEDLLHLCQDRPLPIDELFVGNSFYGANYLLKTYAGLPLEQPLKVVVPHGLSFSDTFVWTAELSAPLPVLWYFSEHVGQAYRQALDRVGGSKLLTPAASPFVYAAALLQDQPQPQRQGTLFFPSHSTHGVTAQLDFAGLAAALAQLDAEYQPVTVCLYWKDLQLNRQLPFQQRGLRVVSAGHMFDPLFMLRLYHLCSMHRYAAGNETGSHMFYALQAGCSYFHFNPLDRVTYTAASETIRKRHFSDTPLSKTQEIEALFAKPAPQPSQQQLDLMAYHLGTQHFKSPAALRQELLAAEHSHLLEYRTAELLNVTPELATELDEIPSETSPAERRLLYSFFAQFWAGQQNVCEIGSFLGGTTRAIALGMMANPQRQPSCQLQTFDRFQHYYSQAQLIDLLEPLFQSGCLSASLKTALEGSDSFLAIFQALHQGRSYSALIQVQEQELPTAVEQVAQLDNLFQLPATEQFDAVFVDGCKGWYPTKYFMLEICSHVQTGAYFLFQDYGWYTCFWIPLFLGRLKAYFRPIVSVDNTRIFQLTQPLTAEVIHQTCPDCLTASDKAWIDKLFTELLLADQWRDEVVAMVSHTLQHGAALAYIGYPAESKAKISGLITQPWAQKHRALVEAALHQPTYQPNGTPIHLLDQEDVADLVKQAESWSSNHDALVEQATQFQAELSQLQGHLNFARDQASQLQAELSQTEGHLNFSRHQVSQTQAELADSQAQMAHSQDRIKRQNQRLQTRKTRVQQLNKQLQAAQAQAMQAKCEIAAMQASKFWKLRAGWLRIRKKLGLG